MFSRMFTNKEKEAAEAAKAAAASRQANAPTRPPNAVQPPGVPGGVIPTHLPPSNSSHATPPSSSRPDPNALAHARKARQAALAAAAFGISVPTTTTPVQPPRTTPGYQTQPPPGGGGFGGPPGGFGAEGMGGDGGGGGGGGDFDMFGGLNVKGPEATPPFPTSTSFNSIPSTSSEAPPPSADSSLLNALNGAEDSSAASGFAFLSDDSAAPSTDDGSSSFSFISSDDSTQPMYENQIGAPSYGLPSPSALPVDTDKLTAAKLYVDQCLSKFWSEWRSLAATESGLKQEEVQLQLSIQYNAAAVKETEDKQGAAVAAEEYEKADSFNAEIDRLKGAINSAQHRLKGVRAEIDAKEQQKAQAAAGIVRVLSDSSQQFEGISQEKAGEMTTFVSTQVASLKSTDASVNSDLQRVEESLSHTEGELDSIQKEDESLSDSLRMETQPFVDEKDNLLTEAHRLENELAELKRQVAAKEKEIANNKEKQKSADRAVEVVRAKNSAQRAAIQQKRARVDDLRSRDVNEKRQIERRRQQLEEDIAQNKKREREFRLSLHDIASQLAHTQFLVSLIQSESKQRESFHSSLRTAEAQIASLQHTLDSHDENLAKSRAELLLLEQQLDSHQKNIAQITIKVPAMEAEKNAAVAARDFKKAATASKEIKTLQQSKADSEAALEELKSKVDAYSAELGNADGRKAEIDREMKRLEEETDIKTLHFLLNREGKLLRRQATASELQQKALAGGRGADGLEHMQKEVESVAVELQWTQVEIRELRGKYGWKEGDHRPPPDLEGEEEEAEVVSHVDDPSPFDSIRGTAVTNGLSGATLGVPVIAARKSSSSSSLSGLSKGRQWTQTDVDGLRQQLTDARGRLTAYEAKLSEALESEDYERADELNAPISKEKEGMAAVEERLAEAEKAVEETKAAARAAEERKANDNDFEEFAEEG